MPHSTVLKEHHLVFRKLTKHVPHLTNLGLFHILAVLFLNAHLGITAVNAESKELFDGLGSVSANDNDMLLNNVVAPDVMEKLKRSWKSLQGSWGKRSEDQYSEAEDDYSLEPEWTLIKPSEKNIEYIESAPEFKSLANGKPDDDDALKYFILFVSNPNTLAAALDNSATSEINDKENNEKQSVSNSNFEKKSWKNMNQAWGKRRSSPAVWNKFRGGWGKREPAWNNLKGMWGKRSTNDWKKLQSAWGKRSQV